MLSWLWPVVAVFDVANTTSQPVDVSVCDIWHAGEIDHCRPRDVVLLSRMCRNANKFH